MTRNRFLVALFCTMCPFEMLSCSSSSSGGSDGSQDTIADLQEEQVVTQDYCGDIKSAFFPIINGQAYPDPEVVNMNPSQIQAIGTIIDNFGAAACTATLVAPNILLTAAHCIAMPGLFSVTFLSGEDYRAPDYRFTAVGWHYHPKYGTTAMSPPEYDVGVVILNGNAAEAGITPIPVNCDTTSLIGETIQAVGYGLTSYPDGYNTRRWWTTLLVDNQSTFYYGAYGNDVTGICQGDSGGPLLYTKPDGKVYVMGVASVGDREDCLGHAYYARTDFNCDFIRDYVLEDPCEGETFQGRCDGEVARWCEDETLMTEDCSAAGKRCGQDEWGNYRCITAPPCEGETFEGRCDGNTAIWCEDQSVNTMDCPEGTVCGNLGDGLFRCVDECMLIGYAGRCDENNFARWCEDGVIKVRDCSVCNQICGWVDDTMGYYCM